MTTPPPTPNWNRGDAIRWWNRDRWWYGVVLDQSGVRVTVQETAKGENRPGGKIGAREANLIEADPVPPLDGYYAAALKPYLVCCRGCTAMRSSTVAGCFCGEVETYLAPPQKTKENKLHPSA